MSILFESNAIKTSFLLFLLMIVGSIASFWQAILLPVAIICTSPFIIFSIHIPLSLSAINMATSCIGYNSEGFLTPNSCVEIEPSFFSTQAKATSKPTFIKYASIKDIQLAVSVTNFKFPSRRNASGRRVILTRGSFNQRLFYDNFVFDRSDNAHFFELLSIIKQNTPSLSDAIDRVVDILDHSRAELSIRTMYDSSLPCCL